MSADVPLSYFFSRAAAINTFGYEPSQALRASSPEGGALKHLPVSSNKALPERKNFPRPGEDVTVGDKRGSVDLRSKDGEGEDAARVP